jgi:uncharacterized protein (TIGR03437 family)
MVSAPDPSLGPLPLPFYRNGRNYWYLYSAPLRLLYLQYAVCQNDAANPFPAFAANLLQTIDSNPVDTLMIDLRDNTGGDSSVINPLLAGLSQRLPSLLANPVFRAYVFINKGTFSSGMDDAITIKSMALQAVAQYPDLPTRLIVAGESTGGKPAHYGNVKAFALPASQLAGQYSTEFFTVPPSIPDTPSFDPDLAVPLRSTDYFARSDSVNGECMARWNGVTSAPTGNAIVLNGASFRAEQGLAPGSIASAFGAFGQTPGQILIGGVAAQILGTTAGQINLLVPVSLTPGVATVSVRAGGVELASGSVTVTATGPGLFVLQSTDPSQPGAIENQDSTVNSQSNPAAAGSVLQIFATGYGPLDSTGAAPVTVLLGGTSAEVLYSGPVGQYPGLWQINARVPNTFTGQLSIQVIAGNAASNAVTLWVH